MPLLHHTIIYIILYFMRISSKNLIGLNFDRVWEGTMSDINYDPSICRNIMVDIRYVLFIVDKFAGATNIIKELKLVSKTKR